MKKKRGAILSALVIVVLILFFGGIILWANSKEHIPLPLLLYFLVPMGAVLIGIGFALKQRMKELKGGEEDEARKY